MLDDAANCGGPGSTVPGLGMLSRRGILGAGGLAALVGLLGVDQVFALAASAISGPIVWPVGPSPAPDPAWGQEFGAPRNNDVGYHKGCDYMRSTGTPIKAMAGGTVIGKGYDASCGHSLRIDHGGVTSYYLHMNSAALPAQGQSVAAGQTIAYVGTPPSTNCGVGAHLHLEVTVNGTLVDPHAWLNQAVNGVPIQRRKVLFAIIAGKDNIWWFVNSMTGKKAQIQSAHLAPLMDIQWWFFGNDPGTRQLPVATFTIFQNYVNLTQ